MKLFRIFSTLENKYVTDTNEWVIDNEGHPISLYSDPESDPELTMREDCVIEWNSGYIDHRGHQIYQGDVFFDEENNYHMVVVWHDNMWVLQIWGWQDDTWEEIDVLPMDDFDFDDLTIAGTYHELGDQLYKGAAYE